MQFTCLDPVQRLPRSSQSMHFGNVAETNHSKAHSDVPCDLKCIFHAQ